MGKETGPSWGFFRDKTGEPLTLHLSLGSLVQSHKKLHDWNQLDLQPQPENRVHNNVVGGGLEDGEARCKTRKDMVKGGRAPWFHRTMGLHVHYPLPLAGTQE